MVDNFHIISTFLNPESDDDFYFLQILQRKKEHSELGSNSRLIKTYQIRSAEHLLERRGEIVKLCEVFNARAYINLNRRSFEKTSLQTIRKVTEQVLNKDFKSAKSAYDSCCGAYSNESVKKWILDIDDADSSVRDMVVGNIVCIINNLPPLDVPNKYEGTIKTKTGYHIITTPFDIAKFRESGMAIDIHKDNPTILYIS